VNQEVAHFERKKVCTIFLFFKDRSRWLYYWISPFRVEKIL